MFSGGGKQSVKLRAGAKEHLTGLGQQPLSTACNPAKIDSLICKKGRDWIQPPETRQ